MSANDSQMDSAGQTPPNELDEASFAWASEFCSSAGCLNIQKKHELLGLIVEQRSLADIEKHESIKVFSQCESVAKRINDALVENKVIEDTQEARRNLQRAIEREFYAKEYPHCFVLTHAPKYAKAFFEDQNRRRRYFPGFCEACVRLQGLWMVFDRRIAPPRFMLQHEMECKDRAECARETMKLRQLLNVQTMPFKAKLVKLPYDDQILDNAARVGTSGEEFHRCYCQVDDTNIVLQCIPDKRLKVGQIAWCNGAAVSFENRYLQEGRTYTFTPVNEMSFVPAEKIVVAMHLASDVGHFEHPPQVVSTYVKDFLLGRLIYEGARFHSNFCGKLTILVVVEVLNKAGRTYTPVRIDLQTAIMVKVPGEEGAMEAI